jgi:DHA2 family multidrug resistance protein-like MFS transporter
MAVLAVGLDGTVLSVALPTLAGKLHASESDLQWFSSSYLLVLAAAMLPAALLGDRCGRKKVMLCSLALFAVGSAVCAASPTSGAFVAAGVLLGFAGAGIIVMSLAALTMLFNEAQRPRAVGIGAAANFVALPIGPILGGWLLTHYWWGWVFLINVPVAVVGLIAVFALVPDSRAQQRPALDLVGAVTYRARRSRSSCTGPDRAPLRLPPGSAEAGSQSAGSARRRDAIEAKWSRSSIRS